MDNIRVDVGVYTAIEVDLSEFDFTGIQKVILTVKNHFCQGYLFEHEFLTPGLHQINITPEQSRELREDAQYDFDIITVDGKRYKNGDNGKIILREGCGQCSASE